MQGIEYNELQFHSIDIVPYQLIKNTWYSTPQGPDYHEILCFPYFDSPIVFERNLNSETEFNEGRYFYGHLSNLASTITCGEMAPTKDGIIFATGHMNGNVSVTRREEPSRMWLPKRITIRPRSPVLCIAWHPSLPLLAVCTVKGKCVVVSAYIHWLADIYYDSLENNIRFGRRLKEIDVGSWPHDAAWSPNGQWLACTGHNSTVFLWNLKDKDSEPIHWKLKENPLTSLLFINNSLFIGINSTNVIHAFVFQRGSWFYDGKIEQLNNIIVGVIDLDKGINNNIEVEDDNNDDTCGNHDYNQIKRMKGNNLFASRQCESYPERGCKTNIKVMRRISNNRKYRNENNNINNNKNNNNTKMVELFSSNIIGSNEIVIWNGLKLMAMYKTAKSHFIPNVKQMFNEKIY